MTSFLGKFRIKWDGPRISFRKLGAFIFLLFLFSFVYLVDGSPAGAFLSLIIIAIFFSTIVSHWRNQNE